MRNTIMNLRIRTLRLLLVPFLVLSTAWAAPTFHVLHAFAGGTDGAYPTSPLLDRSGNLFSVTESGGSLTSCSPYGCGAVYELSLKNGHWKENVLYSFSAAPYPDPVGAVALDSHGNVYGTQSGDGDPSCNCGAVYQLTRSGGIWTENILHNFVGGNSGNSDGAYPYSGLVQDAAGNLYGSTQTGGTRTYGTIFELSPNSDGTWAYSVIYEFGNYPDAAGPYGPLMVDSSGNLYGTTVGGGEYGNGAVFKLSNSGGTWADTVLYNFTLDYGMTPYPYGVAMDAAGNLYGTTLNGGPYAVGSIYKLTPAVGFWNRTVLHTFTGGSDGAYPYGTLAIDASGALYGGTNYGGSFGYGNIYKLVATNGKWSESILHAFTNGSDGAHSITGVILDPQGNVYGTAIQGGAYGFGVVFEITP